MSSPIVKAFHVTSLMLYDGTNSTDILNYFKQYAPSATITIVSETSGVLTIDTQDICGTIVLNTGDYATEGVGYLTADQVTNQWVMVSNVLNT